MSSKIGVHVVLGPRQDYGVLLARLQDAGGGLAVVKCVGDFGAAYEAKTVLGDKVLTLGRVEYWNHVPLNGVDVYNPDGSYRNPVQVASWYYGVVREAWALNPYIDIWETINEQSADWDWQADFYIALMDLMEPDGYRLAMWTFSSGNPPSDAYPAILKTARRALQSRHIFASHEYGGVGTPMGTLQGTEPYHALRYRSWYDDVLIPNQAVVPLVISEAGQNAGYEFIGTDTFVEDLAWYDVQLQQDGYVLGAAAWTLGNWVNANFQEAIPSLGDYLVSQITQVPPPKPEPPKPAYSRTSVLFHPADYKNDSGQPSVWVVALLSAPWWNTQLWTITQSAEDTAITTTDVDLLSRRIIAINPEQWGTSPTLEEWLATYFEPGYEYIPIHADTPEMMIAEIERLVLGVPPPLPEFKLISPVEGIPLVITSPFDAPRDYDGDGIFDDKHEGVDLTAVDASGNPVRILAAAEGVVEQVQNVVGGSYGLFVVIRHDWPDGHTYKTWYAHHSQNLVGVGQSVKAGDPIAIAGMTGNATGIHLHLSLQDIGRGLSGYVLPDVIDPAPYLLPGTLPLPAWTGFVGAGAARSGDMTATEVEALQVARVTAMKGMTNMARDWSVWAQNAGVPQDGLMCRLYFDYSGLGALPTPAQFVTDMRLPINEQRARGCNLFEVGNEPNLELIQFGNAGTIAAWYDDVYSLLLAEWSDLQLVSPGMSPQTDGQWDTQTWLTAFRDAGILERSYLVGAHCYWHSRSMMFDVAQGWNFSRWQSFLKPGQQMSITEFSNNGGVDSDADIGKQYAEWSAKLPPYVHSAYAFCLSSDDPLFNQRRETWVRGGAITDIARSFGARE